MPRGGRGAVRRRGGPRSPAAVALALGNIAYDRSEEGRHDEGRRDEALAVLADVVARGAGDDDPDIHRYVGSALTDTAELLHGDDPEGAIAALDALLARFGDLTDPNMRILVAAALARRGRYLEDQGRAREALATYRDLRDRFPRSEGPYVDRHVAHGMRRAAALAARSAERLRRRLGRR